MIRILFFTIVMTFFSNNSEAQLGAMMRKDFTALKESTMLYVQSGNVETDSVVESFLRKEWDFIPTKVVSEGESHEYIGNPDYSFMTFVTQSSYEEQERIESTCLFVVTTTEKDAQTKQLDITGNRAGYIVFDNDRSRQDGGYSFTYKLPDLLRGLQSMFKYAENKGNLSSTLLSKDYAGNRRKLVDHTLLLESNLIDENFRNDEEEFSEYYPAPYKIVSSREVKEAVDDKASKNAYLYVFRDGGGIKNFIIEAGTGEILWYDFDPTDKAELAKIEPKFFKRIKIKKYTK